MLPRSRAQTVNPGYLGSNPALHPGLGCLVVSVDSKQHQWLWCGRGDGWDWLLCLPGVTQVCTRGMESG